MNAVTKTAISVLSVFSLTFGSALPSFATTITGESIPSTTKLQRESTKKPPLIDGFVIKVEGGTATPAKAKKGIKVTANAGATPTGKIFTGWTSNCDLEFADPKAKSTTFTMPGYAIIIQANFEDILSPVSTDNRIVAHSYRNTFEIGKETLSARQKSDGIVLASLILPTIINRSGTVQAALTDADLLACIANGKAYMEKCNVKSGMQVEILLPVAPEYSQIAMKIPYTTWNILQTDGISSFSIASKEGTFQFNQSAINAMSTQNRADSKLTFLRDNPGNVGEGTIYKFNILYEGEGNSNSDIGHFIMPTSGITALVPYELENEKNASKVSIMGVNAEGISAKASGASYNSKLEAVSFPIGSYVYYSVGF